MKPNLVVHLARKPIEGTVAQNALVYGTGGLNINACRIGTGGDKGIWPIMARNARVSLNAAKDETLKPVLTATISGRWPANLILEHFPDCRLAGTVKIKGAPHLATANPGVQRQYGGGCFGGGGVTAAAAGYKNKDGTETVDAWECELECPCKVLDEQSDIPGESAKTGKRTFRSSSIHFGFFDTERGWAPSVPPEAPSTYGDTGGASRFFKQVQEPLDLTDGD